MVIRAMCKGHLPLMKANKAWDSRAMAINVRLIIGLRFSKLLGQNMQLNQSCMFYDLIRCALRFSTKAVMSSRKSLFGNEHQALSQQLEIDNGSK